MQPARPQFTTPMPNKRRCRCSNPIPRTGFSGLGADQKTTVELTAAGAKVGSAIPVVGTAIGAVVGFVASKLIKTGQKPQRAAAAAQMEAALRNLPAGFNGSMLSREDMGHVWYMLIINHHMYAWQSSHPENHPSAMDAHYELTEKMGRELITKIIQTPVGQTVTQSFHVDVNNQTFSYTYKNPGCNDTNAIAQILLGMQLKFCALTNPAANCNAMGNDVMVKIAFKLLVEYLQNILCPKTVAAPTVVTSAPAPVARPPVQSVPVPAPAPVVAQNTGIVPPTPVTPGSVTATGNGIDVNALVSSLMAQGANQQQAYASALQALQSQGVQPTAAVQGQVAQAVQTAGGVSGVPSWVLYGAMGLAVVFALARPARAGGRHFSGR